MKTSQEWWNEVKANPEKFETWLKKQYHGEITAADRIEAYMPLCTNARHSVILGIIATQERKHAGWVGELLKNRGVTPERIANKVTPYWDETLSPDLVFEELTAAASLAEKMRLERIRVIVSDVDAPRDVQEVFSKILPEEVFHERAFKEMSNTESLMKAFIAHGKGLDALGLIMVQEVL